MTNLKAFGLLTVLMLVLGGALAFIGFSTGVYEVAEKEYLQSFGGIGNDTVVTVKSVGGDITVRPWVPGHNMSDRIEVSAVFKTLWGNEVLEDADIKVTQGADFIIEGDLKEKAKHSVTIHVTVHLPSFVTVKTLKTSNGDVSLRNLAGDVYIKTSNGRVDVQDHNGSLEIDTSNGRIEVERVQGDLKLDSSNGRIWVREVFGTVSAGTDNGYIDIRDVDYVSKAESSNGNIRVDCRNISADGMNLDTTNGDISVHLPADLSFELDLDTSNGHADVHGFAVLYTRADKEHKTGIVIGGGPLLKADSSNGDIDIYATEVV